MDYTAKDVTVITPAYIKSSEYVLWLLQCIESVLHQGCNQIIVDDGSVIDVSNVVSRYGGRVKYIKFPERNGPAYCRNHAVSQCNTKLILPVDCDDILKEDALQKMLKVYNETGIPVYSDLYKFGTENVPHYPLKDVTEELLRSVTGLAAVTVLHSVEQHYAIGSWESMDLYEDGFYNAKLFATYCGIRIQEPLLGWRQHDKQRHRNMSMQVKNRIYVLERLKELKMCCRKPIRSTLATIEATKSAVVTAAPVRTSVARRNRQGMLKVRYLGGRGRGPHNYRSRVTNTQYRLVHGQIIDIDAQDYNAASSIFEVIEDEETEQQQVAESKVQTPESKVGVVQDTESKRREGIGTGLSSSGFGDQAEIQTVSEENKDIVENFSFPWPMTVEEYSKFKYNDIKLMCDVLASDEISTLIVLEGRRGEVTQGGKRKSVMKMLNHKMKMKRYDEKQEAKNE